MLSKEQEPESATTEDVAPCEHPPSATAPYSPKYNRLAGDLALLGLDDAKIAALMGIPYETFRIWYLRNPSLRRAVDTARGLADAQVARSLFKCAVGYRYKAVKIMNLGDRTPTFVPYTKVVEPDPNAALAWLRLRQPELWQEITRTLNANVNVSADKPFRLPRNMTAEDKRKALSAIETLLKLNPKANNDGAGSTAIDVAAQSSVEEPG